jgi:hypothetical protein
MKVEMLAECSDRFVELILIACKKQMKRSIQTQLYLVAFYYTFGYVSAFIRSHHQAYMK